MKPARVPGTEKCGGSFTKMLEGYDTGQLLMVLGALREIFRQRGLEVNFTTRAAPKPDEPVVH